MRAAQQNYLDNEAHDVDDVREIGELGLTTAGVGSERKTDRGRCVERWLRTTSNVGSLAQEAQLSVSRRFT